MGMLIGDKESYNEEYFNGKTPKELAIEKAWVELVGFVPEHDANGYQNDIIIDVDWDRFDYETVGHGLYKIRPKSLAGIENNNGWKKSNEELPPDNNTLVWTICNGVKSIMMYSHKHFDDNNGNLFDIQRVSEWQPVIVPADKLY